VLRNLAAGYADSVGYGEETVRARITVLRDGVSLAVAAALLYAAIWPLHLHRRQGGAGATDSFTERGNDMRHDLYTHLSRPFNNDERDAEPSVERDRPHPHTTFTEAVETIDNDYTLHLLGEVSV
jgi:hypothetical protein